MSRCPRCSGENAEDMRFCGRCGAPLDDQTLAATAAAPGTPSHPSLDDSRFLPGTMLAERYRIVGLLGRGGMGEVYRADDLKLGQTVALKFLPQTLQTDASRRSRFLTEVKISRQISHPNVCRVYDVGEVEGHTFLSMEFIDGEDLASLLRRIGRLPADKAVEIGRQLCSGLAAAHDQGVLHRDFKPANVMIDGRGRARITDFGLAALAGGVEQAEIRSGTPKYMAPEQLAGKEVTVRSDIYALGLVLYEVFTGKQAFEADTAAELLRLQSVSSPTTPSSHVSGLDPAVERAILRCLEKDPVQRPASALAVAASLPGGDPLAAALAAGETPSPEMVAEAGSEGVLPPAAAVGLLAICLAGLIGLSLLWGLESYFGREPMEKSTAVLVDRAAQVVRDLGYDEAPVDTAFGIWGPDWDYREHLREEVQDRADTLAFLAKRPKPYRLWYRESPRPLVVVNPSGRVNFGDPPVRISGMAQVVVDADGRLWFFQSVPPQKDEVAEAGLEMDWALPFRLAGLEPDAFEDAPPTWVPEVFCDERRTWSGTYPGQEAPILTVEGCAYRGRLVYFELIHPWDRPWRMQEYQPKPMERVAAVVGALAVTSLLLGALYLARRNVLMGRGDRRGALRLATFLTLLNLAIWALTAHHIADASDEIDRFFEGLAGSLLGGCLVWLLYMALEPFVRRHWPEVLVSWTRLLSGKLRDPLVGRHVLFGASFGIAVSLIDALEDLLPGWLGVAPTKLLWFDTRPLQGARFVAARLSELFVGAIFSTVIMLFFLVLFRVLLRRQWLAVAATVLLFTALGSLGDRNFLFDATGELLIVGLLVFCLIRFGVLAGVALTATRYVAASFRLTEDLSAWYAGPSWVALVVVFALLAFAFHASLGGRTLLKVESLDA